MSQQRTSIIVAKSTKQVVFQRKIFYLTLQPHVLATIHYQRHVNEQRRLPSLVEIADVAHIYDIVGGGMTGKMNDVGR